jgi:uncharacterized protein (DUF983 family)
MQNYYDEDLESDIDDSALEYVCQCPQCFVGNMFIDTEDFESQDIFCESCGYFKPASAIQFIAKDD